MTQEVLFSTGSPVQEDREPMITLAGVRKWLEGFTRIPGHDVALALKLDEALTQAAKGNQFEVRGPIEITIKGPMACGKTVLGDALEAVYEKHGYKVWRTIHRPEPTGQERDFLGNKLLIIREKL